MRCHFVLAVVWPIPGGCLQKLIIMDGPPKKPPTSIPSKDHTGVQRHSSHSPSTNDDVTVIICPWSDHSPKPAQSIGNFQLFWEAPHNYLGIQHCFWKSCHCNATHPWRNCSSRRTGSWKVSKNHEIILDTKKPGERRTWLNGNTSSKKYWLFHSRGEITTTSDSGSWFLCFSCSYQSPECQIKLIIKAFLTTLHLPDSKSHLWDPFPTHVLF